MRTVAPACWHGSQLGRLIWLLRPTMLGLVQYINSFLRKYLQPVVARLPQQLRERSGCRANGIRNILLRPRLIMRTLPPGRDVVSRYRGRCAVGFRPGKSAADGRASWFCAGSRSPATHRCASGIGSARKARVDADDLSKHEDDLHYDSAGQLALGRRLAEAWLALR